MEWYLEVLKKYAEFDGRARRKEYWMFVLFNAIISIGLQIVGALLGLKMFNGQLDILGTLYSLVVLIPSIAVSIRRLHDIGKSGWWLLIAFIPCIGAFVLLYFLIQNSQQESNQYGPNPKGM